MRIWQLYPQVNLRIRKAHAKVGLVGAHDFNHAFRVGEVATMIALEEWADHQLATSAGLAGMTHNADHVLRLHMKLPDDQEPPSEKVTALVRSWLRDSWKSPEQQEEIVQAVLRHTRRNADDDSKVQIALQDADRVVNMDLDLWLRSGQFRPNIPAVDYEHFTTPQGTYRNPKSVLEDVANCMDWVTPGSPVCVRTTLGLRMGQARAEIFRDLFGKLLRQYEEEGIFPYPFSRP